nr:MAG TPA: hypothetical protein [Caudoviricetes sp.]
MKQLTQSEIRKNGKVYKNVSSPATEGTMKQVTDIVEKDGTFSISTDEGKTYSPAGGAVPEALPQEASALKSGNLPTTGWTNVSAPLWQGVATFDKNGNNKTLLCNIGVKWNNRDEMPLTGWAVEYSYISDTVNRYTAKTFQKNDSLSTKGIICYFGIDNTNPYLEIDVNGDVYGWTEFTYISGRIIYKIEQQSLSKQGYTISDTSITANSDILMELTDEGGVKAYSMEAGSITVIRDTVPTQPIPYTYKIKQTNASGQFTLVNHFVPSVPESPTSLPVTYKKVSGELPTSGWTNVDAPISKQGYTISDTDITANTSVKMYLTDEGGVKAQSKANGSITVIRDEVPTTAIPYEYEVEQTSAEGLFEVINAYVPTKTSDLTNDSNFAKTTEANTWTGVQTFSNADGIKTDRVHNLDNNDAWYNFDGSNNRFGSPLRPTIIRTSEARPRAQVPSGETTVTKAIALLEDVPAVGEWQDWTSTSALTEEGLYEIIVEGGSNFGYTVFIQYEQGQYNFGACWVSATSTGILVIEPKCSADGKLSVNKTSSSSGEIEPLDFKYRKIR